MILTTEQLQAVKAGKPVTISDPDIGQDCVLVRADVFSRVRTLIEPDSDYDPRDAYPLINDIMREDDAHDPWLERYQDP